MKLTSEHGASIAKSLYARVDAGLNSVGATHASVIVTGDFDKTVRRLTGSPGYFGDRGSGTVVAKTLAAPSAIVVLNQRAIRTLSLTPGDLERFTAHEGCHVLMYDRDESISQHHDLATSQGEFDLLAAAAGVIEEYRCELTTVRERGYPPQRGCTLEDLSTNLCQSNVDFVEAVRRQDRDRKNPQALFGKVASSVALPLAKTLAVTSAGAVAVDGDLAQASFHSGRDDWLDYVRPTWARRLAFFSSLPSALEGWRAEHYREALRVGAQIERAFRRDVGFEYDFKPSGEWGFQDALSDERFFERERRARRR